MVRYAVRILNSDFSPIPCELTNYWMCICRNSSLGLLGCDAV